MLGMGPNVLPSSHRGSMDALVHLRSISLNGPSAPPKIRLTLTPAYPRRGSTYIMFSWDYLDNSSTRLKFAAAVALLRYCSSSWCSPRIHVRLKRLPGAIQQHKHHYSCDSPIFHRRSALPRFLQNGDRYSRERTYNVRVAKTISSISITSRSSRTRDATTFPPLNNRTSSVADRTASALAILSLARGAGCIRN